MHIQYESKQEFVNSKFKDVTSKFISQAKKLNAKKLIEISKEKFIYNHSNGKQSTVDITTDIVTCTCAGYLDVAMFAHIVCCCLNIEKSLPGLTIKKKMYTRCRVKNKKKLFDSDAEEETSPPISEETSAPTASIPRKRGRPKKLKALENNLPEISNNIVNTKSARPARSCNNNKKINKQKNIFYVKMRFYYVKIRLYFVKFRFFYV